MAVFWLGMFAACLWLAVGYTMIRLARQRPAHPFRSISRFRRARRRMAPEAVLMATPAILREPDAPEPDPTVIETPPAHALADAAPRKTPPPRKPKPRRIGRLTYVVVDEDGMPEHSELLRT